MKAILRLFLVLILIVCCSGCARQANTESPARFSEGPLRFDYPGNWKVTTNEPLGSGRLVILEEPGSAIVTVTTYPSGQDVTLESYGKLLKEHMTTSKLGMLMKITDHGSRETPASLEFKFIISVGSIQVPHTMEVTQHVLGGHTLFCMSQVADEDRHLVQAGFDLIRGSLAVDQ